MKKDLKLTTSVRTDLATLLETDNFPIKPFEAFYQGINLQSAVKEMPDVVRGWLLSEVARLIKEINANKTLSSDEELKFCCKSILEEHPTITLQELRLTFNMIRQGKFGKLFERLQTAEILECLRRYEYEVRADMIEREVLQVKSKSMEKSERKLEPLNLCDLVKESPAPTPNGLGSQIRKQWDKSNGE